MKHMRLMWACVNATVAVEFDTYLQLKIDRLHRLATDYCNSTIQSYQLEGADVARVRADLTDRLLESKNAAESKVK